MVRQIPDYLKLVHDGGREDAPTDAGDFKHLAEVCRTFEQATGWPLELAAGPPSKAAGLWSAPVELGVGKAGGHLRIAANEKVVDDRGARASLKRAGSLAGAVAELWRELIATRRALWQREAELAAGVPVAVRREDSGRLAARLEAILQAGAESLGCQAAALYLLDEATTELKLRACWGLSRDRLLCAARPLQGALADLEALLGHAVVLTDDSLHHYWKPPEEFPASACVPIASNSNPLGTLWIFSSQPRDFTDSQTNLLEVLAGSIAAELERQVLMDESVAARSESRSIDTAALPALPACPTVPPLCEGWDVAGRALQSAQFGGAFCDWFARPDGALSLVLSCAGERGLPGTLTAHAVRAAARADSHAPQPDHSVLHSVNTVLWTTSAGDQCASLFHARLHASTKTVSFASSGLVRAMRVRSTGMEPLQSSGALLGTSEVCPAEPPSADQSVRLDRGDLLIVYAHSTLGGQSSLTESAFDEQLAEIVRRAEIRSADHLADLAAEALAEHFDGSADHALLVFRRR